MDASAPPQYVARKAPKATRNQVSFMELPSDIMAEILSRLSVQTIMPLITGPLLVALQFYRGHPGLVVHQFGLYQKFLRLVDLDDAHDDHQNHVHHPLNTMLEFNPSNLSSFPDANIVVDGSVDGLLLLRDIHYNHETLYICNPLTREYVTLPKPHGTVIHPRVATCGFGVVTDGLGVAATSRKYKVVRIFHGSRSCIRIPHSVCQVYTLGTGAWRSIGGAPFCYVNRSVGLFFRGNVHWLIEDLEGRELISCFDLKNELFQPFPPPFPPPFPRSTFLGSLGVLKGCLCLCDNTSYSDIDIWVMNEYGVEKSWTREFVIRKNPELAGQPRHIVHALKVFRNGDIWLVWGNIVMLYYCSTSEVLREVDMDHPCGEKRIEAMHHVPTFLTLRSIVKENAMEKVSMF